MNTREREREKIVIVGLTFGIRCWLGNDVTKKHSVLCGPKDSPFSLLLLWPFVATFNRRGGIGEIVGHRALLSTKMERPPAKGEKFTQSQRARKKENAILG